MEHRKSVRVQTHYRSDLCITHNTNSHRTFFKVRQRSTIFLTLLHPLEILDNRVLRSARRVASILRQPASLRATRSRASCRVAPKVLIPLRLSPRSPCVTRYRANVPPILVLVLNSPRRKLIRVLRRPVRVTPRPVIPPFPLKSGRISDFSVASNYPFGPITLVLESPAYLVELSKATRGQKVEWVPPAVQKVLVNRYLVRCILGCPSSNRIGILIDYPLGNESLSNRFCPTLEGVTFINAEKEPLSLRTRPLNDSVEDLVLSSPVLVRVMVVLLPLLVCPRVPTTCIPLFYPCVVL